MSKQGVDTVRRRILTLAITAAGAVRTAGWAALLAAFSSPSLAHTILTEEGTPAACPSPQVRKWERGSNVYVFQPEFRISAVDTAFACISSYGHCEAHINWSGFGGEVTITSHFQIDSNHNRTGQGAGSFFSGSICALPPCSVELTLTGGGRSVESGEPLHGFTAQALCGGQAAKDVAVEIKITIQPSPGSSGINGQLLRAEGEQAACSSGQVMSCTTDADGTIQFAFLAPAEAGVHDITARCTDPNKPCNQAGPVQVTVKGCPIQLKLEGGGEVEPGADLPGLLVQATCNGEPADGVAVEINATVQQNSGFHQHHDDLRPRGTLSAGGCTATNDAATLSCSTGPEGTISFSFKGPAPAGTHDIAARCTDKDKPCNPAGPINVTVKVDGLARLSTGLYLIQEIGQRPEHPSNHHLRPDAREKLTRLALDYFYEFDEPLYINDASLPWGGVFDLAKNWQEDHKEHRCGRAVDIRGNGNPSKGAVPPENKGGFLDLAEDVGIGVLEHGCSGGSCSNAHYHLWLLGKDRKEDKGIVKGTKTCSDLP